MKNLKLVVVLLLLSLPFGTFGQNQKFGYLNSQEVLALMPEVTAAQKKIDSMEVYYKELLGTIEQDLQGLYAKAQGPEIARMTDLQKAILREDIQQKEQRYVKVQETAQSDLQDMTQKLIEPIKKKLKDVIKEIAKESNFTYIFDTSLGTLLYSPEGDDISALVKKKLNIKDTPPAATGGKK